MQERIYYCLMIFTLCCLGQTAQAGPPYAVNDPETPERHWIELNIGYLSSHGRGYEIQEYPSIDINYSYLNNLQLTLAVTGVSIRESGAKRKPSFADVWTEVKWRFQEEKKNRPQLALDYAIKLPTAGRSQGLGTGNVDHTMLLIGQKAIGRLTIFGNVGINIVGNHDGRNNALYGIVCDYQLTEHLDVGAEVYGNTSAAVGERAELAWGLGLTYRFAPDRALLLKAGRSVQGFSDLDIYAGVQFNLGKKQKGP